MSIDTIIASRVRALRKVHGLTLEVLAERSGVSRSTISSIERAETSPTAAVLNKLADALGVALAALFSPEERAAAPSPLTRLADQPVWTDPASGYQRRRVSPADPHAPLELAEIVFPPGRSVSFDSPLRHVAVHQLVWMFDGVMEITVGSQTWRLSTGDCLSMRVDQHLTFRNPTRKPARYAVSLTTTPQALGSRP
jgi:transcriptional regulator with XRE-family HTH domain